MHSPERGSTSRAYVKIYVAAIRKCVAWGMDGTSSGPLFGKRKTVVIIGGRGAVGIGPLASRTLALSSDGVTEARLKASAKNSEAIS